MATNNTKKTGARSAGKDSTAAKKTTTAKKKTGGNGSGTKASVNKQTKASAVKKTPRAKDAEMKKVPREELVPELSNELVLLITLVVSVLLFLSNFSLSGKVGEFISQVTFGLFGVLAYVIPFFLFFGIAFYLANKESNKRYIVKLVASIGLFTVVAALLQLVFSQTTGVEFLEYYKLIWDDMNNEK